MTEEDGQRRVSGDAFLGALMEKLGEDSPLAGLGWGGETKLVTADSYLETLMEAMLEPDIAVLVVYFQVTKVEELVDGALKRNVEDATATMSYAIVTGELYVGNKPYNALLKLQGFPPPAAVWDIFAKRGIVGAELVNFTYTEDWAKNDLKFTAGFSDITSKPRFTSLSDSRFLAMFETNSVPLMSKVLTALASHYPWAIKELTDFGEYTTPEEMEVHYQLPPDVGNTLPPAEFDRKLKSALAVCVLIPAYSDEKSTALQVCKRIRAACVSYGSNAPEENHISDAMNHFVKSNQMLPNEVTGVMGVFMGRDKNMNFDLQVLERDIPDAADLKRAGHTMQFPIQLYGQAQMVYTGHHQSTIGFVLELDTLIKAHKVVMSPKVVEEQEAVAAMRALVTGRPFVAMTSTQVHALRVESFPCHAYSALHYRLSNLTSEDERATFKKFNFEGVASHLKSVSDKELLKARVASLPGPVLNDVLDQVKHASSSQVDSFLSLVRDVSAETLYLQCVHTGTTGPWFNREKKKADLATQMKYQTAYVAKAEELIKGQCASVRSAITHKVPLPKQGMAQVALQNLEERFNRDVKSAVSIRDILINAGGEDDSVLLNQYLEYYDGLVDSLKDIERQVIESVGGD